MPARGLANPCGLTISSRITARKGDRVAVEPVADQDGAVGFDEPEDQARDERAAHAAEAAEHDDGERLVADDGADGGIDEIVQQGDESSRKRGEG